MIKLECNMCGVACTIELIEWIDEEHYIIETCPACGSTDLETEEVYEEDE